ncbi:MAG: hypothetical protein A3F74_07105 [Betaproteobacteria bacterium RIFCSPLOWO2_12_FULL_62_58]|nr:MAG: hypothetical protein A3F74_07105 [Betaproteobacteria bacterium RIFCSPLOWO2_12_FULL_62_58]
MIPKECKRLAEVDFPIAVVSKHAAREKSIRHGQALVVQSARQHLVDDFPRLPLYRPGAGSRLDDRGCTLSLKRQRFPGDFAIQLTA